MENKDARSLPAVVQEELRKKAVKAVLSGRKQKEVAKLFGVTEQAVCKWMKQYWRKGVKALKAKKRGRPGGGKLRPWQAAQIARAITDRCPDQLKLPFYLWTRESVAQLIKRRYNIILSVWTIGRYLKRWGFTPQKPVCQAFERNPEQVRHWLKIEYPAIRNRAKREKAMIYWEDETGMRSDHAVGRSYGRKGITPVIPGTGKRFGCNMISAITNRGRLNFMVFKNRFHTNVFLNFLWRLVRQIKRKIFLIVDCHPVHKSRKVKNWIKKYSPRIRLFYLPDYSPELNPDEVLNQDVKSNALGRRRPHNQQELLSQIRSYLKSRQRQPKTVRKYFHEKHVRYAAI